MKVTEFKGEYAFLCNFYKVYVPFVYNGVTYNTSEAAFQAAKYNGHNAEMVHKVFAKCTPDESKKLGRAIKLRKDWEEVKDSIMFDVVKAKFDADPELKQKLLDTGDMELIEGNTWGDVYWGVCNGQGQNRLGITLMQLRDYYEDERAAALGYRDYLDNTQKDEE